MNRRLLAGIVLTCAAAACSGPAPVPAPDVALREADRLAWGKAWGKAEPLYLAAVSGFGARGDRRGQIYAEVGALRAAAPRSSASASSERLVAYLNDPVVLADDHLRLRVLIIKSEIDINLDPEVARASLHAALALARALKEEKWYHRLEGELSITSFLQGQVAESIASLASALKQAEAVGDVPAQIRFLTLFGLGYIQVARYEESLTFFDRALEAWERENTGDVPVMTYVGKIGALARLGRRWAAQRLLLEAMWAARRQGATAHEAELTMIVAGFLAEAGNPWWAAKLYDRGDALARKAGATRSREEVALERAKVLVALGRTSDADQVLQEATALAREMQDRILLPRLIGQLAQLRLDAGQLDNARELLDEASQISEGLLASVSSPWLRARLIRAFEEVFEIRINLEARQNDTARVFAVVEQARARSLADLLAATRRAGDVAASPHFRDAELRISDLQKRLIQATDASQRTHLLGELFFQEEQLGPESALRFAQLVDDITARPTPASLADAQQALHDDEMLIEFVLAAPSSLALVVTRREVTATQLPQRGELENAANALGRVLEAGGAGADEARALAALLAPALRHAAGHDKLLISVEGALNQVPFELLPSGPHGTRLLEQHTIFYVPSGTVLVRLRARATGPAGAATRVLAVTAAAPTMVKALPISSLAGVTRAVYDFDGAALPELPSARAEVNAVVRTLSAPRSVALTGAAATEAALKDRPLDDFAVLHFAVHGVVSTQFPERSALVLRPGVVDDGLLQAREILLLRLRADLVTLSACSSANGTAQGRDGVSSLVRPFLAAGGRAVVANLWSADDRFSLVMMREFYRQLRQGIDKATALRNAKLAVLKRYGADTPPRLWAGLVLYGDGSKPLPVGLVQRSEGR